VRSRPPGDFNVDADEEGAATAVFISPQPLRDDDFRVLADSAAERFAGADYRLL